MMIRPTALGLLVACALSAQLAAEVPLPDTVVFGTIEIDGNLIGSGNLGAVVTRAGLDDLLVVGEWADQDGIPHYVIRVPMETQLGAPGPSGLVARNGDVLASIELNNGTIAQPALALQAGQFLKFSVGNAPQPEPEPNPPPPEPEPDPPSPEPEPDPGAFTFARGDCSGDGSYDLSDGVFALNFLFLANSKAPPCKKACDGNDDGALNISDGTFLLNFLFLGGPAPAEPRFPVCGADPTPDGLSCDATNCLDGEGGGAGAGVFLTTAGPSSAPYPFPRVAEPPLESDSAGLDERSLLLALSPRAIDFGALTGRGTQRSVTLRNLSPTEGLDLVIESTTARFSVSPTSYYLRPEGSLVVLCEESTAPMTGADEDLPASIRITEADLLLGDVALHSDESASESVVGLGSIAVHENTVGALEIPIEVSENVDAFLVTFGYDEFYFAPPEIVAADGVNWSVASPWTAGGLSATATLASGRESSVIGHLVLTPLAPLVAGTYPVSVAATQNDRDHVSSAHGEICVQTPWLDVDGDGIVVPETDQEYLARYVAGSLLNGTLPIMAEEWISARIEERLDYFDVDLSGEVDAIDLAWITVGLSGQPLPDTNVDARVHNLSAPTPSLGNEN